jgi:nitroreductase
MATSNLQEQSQERLLSEAIAGRRATPSFDGSPVPDKVLSAVVHAGIEAPSGFNLQPWRFIVVRDAAQKRRLREAAMGQAKVEEAGAVIVCCGDLNAPCGQNLNDVLAESARHGFSEEQNRRMAESVNGVFGQPPGNVFGLTPDYAVWVNRHVMIAVTTMMWMAEALGYDTAPMEGFFEDKVKSTLDIPDGVRVVALLGIGRLKGPDKPYAGRHETSNVCFAEKWGQSMKL